MESVDRDIAVTYPYTLEVYSALARTTTHTFLERFPFSGFWFCAYMSIGLIAVLFIDRLGLRFSEKYLALFAMGLALIVLAWLGTRYLGRRLLSSFYRGSGYSDDLPMTASIVGDAVAFACPRWQCQAPVTALYSVTRGDGFLVIRFSRLAGMAIPESAFTSAEALETFISRLGGLREAVKIA